MFVPVRVYVLTCSCLCVPVRVHALVRVRGAREYAACLFVYACFRPLHVADAASYFERDVLSYKSVFVCRAHIIVRTSLRIFATPVLADIGQLIELWR